MNTPSALRGRRVLLAVTGGIAAYRSAELARALMHLGAEVRVLMTEHATRLVTPLTFATLTGQPVATDAWRRGDEPEAMPHIALRQWAEVLVVCPATANALGKCAHGIADDILSTTYLSCSRLPVVFAPAMNPDMWAHPAVRDNVAVLRRRGHAIIGPARGGTACGEEGEGRLVPLAAVTDAVRAALHGRGFDCGGRRMLITAGPTQEPLDGVRVLTNRSSGQLGYALAQAAALRGADVVMVSGPVALPAPWGVRLVRVATAQEMHAAVLAELRQDDTVVGAAAVADHRPAQPAAGKPAKRGDAIALAENPDIIAAVAATRKARAVIGFCAAIGDVRGPAREKLQRKQLDAIVGNEVSGAAMGGSVTELLWLPRAGAESSSGHLAKDDAAHWLLDRIISL